MPSRLPLYLLTAVISAGCATTATSPPSVASRPTGDPNGLTPLGASTREITRPLVRVGLETDAPSVSFPRIDGGYILTGDAGASAIRRGLTITAPHAGEPVRWSVRVATLETEAAAEQEASRVRAMVSAPIEIIEDAAGKWRVLAGDFDSSAAGEPLRDELLLEGIKPPIYVVRRPAATEFTRELIVEDDESNRTTVSGKSLLIVPASGQTIAIGGKPYRGGARVWINDRGLLNVINEVNLEDYVRGVVPGELGPRTYDELEAQKAQAIAARTYVVRRLGEYASEGYDICPTPACQVYSGYSIEEPLSNQAIDATAGQVMVYEGEPIDSLFTSTCGGETSDVATMFPGRSDPYLQSVRCVELDTVELRGRRQGEVVNEIQANAVMFAAASGLGMEGPWTAREVSAAAAAANRIAGYTPSSAAAPPVSARRGDVIDYLSRLWGLGELGSTLTLPEDRHYFFDRGRAGDPRAAAQAFLIKYGIGPPQAATGEQLSEPMPRAELYALLMGWIHELGVWTDLQGRVAAVDGNRLAVKVTGGDRTFELAPGIPLFRRFRERHREEAVVPVMIGDRVRVIHDRANRPLAVVIEANYDGAAFDRTSGFSNWTRSHRAHELVDAIAKRVPIRELQDLRPLSVDEAERVERLEVTAEGGRTFVLEGIQVRFALGVPDNLFEIVESEDADGVDRYTFFGKGWGHGTGMCQIGAYGMAFRGWTADRILKHFYTGIEIVPVSTLDL